MSMFSGPQFKNATDDVFKFKLRAPREAHIALLSKPAEFQPIYEIIIGTAKNQKSIIRKDFTEVLVTVDTPDILDARQFRNFWINWKNNTISVGRDDDSFMSYAFTENDLFDINYIGIRVGDNERGTWLLESTRKYSGPGFWVPAANGSIPECSVPAGYNNEKLYIARVKHERDLLPGCLVPSKGGCFVPYDEGVYKYTNYEVFCGSGGQWQIASNGEVPDHAIKGGWTEFGEALYLGRVKHNDAILLGKVHSSHGCCYIPFEGQELSFKEYEILVWEPFSMMNF